MIIFCFVAAATFGQTGIGTKNPDPSSILHLSSTDKGFLIPRLQLSDVKDTATIPVSSADEGIVVFNLADNGTGTDIVHKETFYIWTGDQWESIANLTDARDYIEIYNISSTVFIAKPPAYTAKAMPGANVYTAWETIVFSNELKDLYNIHDNGIFTADEDGLYSFSGNIAVSRSSNAGDNKSFGARILLRRASAPNQWIEVTTSYFGTTPGGSAGSMPVYWTGEMDVGDQVQVQFRVIDSNGSGTYSLNAVQTSINVIENFKRN